jgi:hypothetical protein
MIFFAILEAKFSIMSHKTCLNSHIRAPGYLRSVHNRIKTNSHLHLDTNWQSACLSCLEPNIILNYIYVFSQHRAVNHLGYN